MRSFSLAALALFLGHSALGAPYIYRCYPDLSGGGTAEEMTVKILNAGQATIEGHKVHLDPTYKPRKNKNYVRFDGDVDWLNADGYEIDLLFHRQMIAGASKTSIKVMARGEGFYNDFYNCYRR